MFSVSHDQFTTQINWISDHTNQISDHTNRINFFK